MDLSEFRNLFNEALNSNKTISFFSRCSILYSGRAEAELAEGDRLIIIKSDNTLIIHQPEGSAPVNYMKAESSIELFESNGFLLLKSVNQKLKDELDILIKKVYSFQAHKLEDGCKITLAGSEKDMSDMIRDMPKLISDDFKPLSREEHNKFGFIDVFGHDGEGNLVIVECKRYTAGLSAIEQLRRYVEKMSELKGVDKKKIKGVLAAPEIAKNAEDMLISWGFVYKKVFPPKRLE
jgi:RecB family endonuclease NucS